MTAVEGKSLHLDQSRLQTAVLDEISSAARYHAWLRELALPHLGDDPLEFGSGLGDYAQALVENGLPRITVSEVPGDRLSHLRARFHSDDRVRVVELDITNAPAGQYSSVVSFNVLEHVDDHVGALRGAARLVRPRGAVVALVPAFDFAMSDFDRRIGHVRRYRKADLREAYEAAGLEVEVLHYVNAPGLLAWFVMMRLLRRTPQDGQLLRLWDGLVIRAVRVLERKWKPPFGQSLFAVGRVPLN